MKEKVEQMQRVIDKREKLLYAITNNVQHLQTVHAKDK